MLVILGPRCARRCRSYCKAPINADFGNRVLEVGKWLLEAVRAAILPWVCSKTAAKPPAHSAFVFLVINQVELLKKVRFKGASRNHIAENVLPLVTSQENHVLIYLANQLWILFRVPEVLLDCVASQRCNKQQGNFANTWARPVQHAKGSRKSFENRIQSLGDTLARSSLIALEVKRRPWPSHSITCEGPPSLLIAFMVSLFY